MDRVRPALYLALLLILVLIWQAWNQDYGQPPTSQGPAPGAEQRTADQDQASSERADVPSAPAAREASPAAEPEAGGDKGEPIRVVTDVLDVRISPKGGDIVRAALPTYPVSSDRPEEPFVLLETSDKYYIAQSGLIHERRQGMDTEGRAPSHHARFTADQQTYKLQEGQERLQVPLTWEGPDGITVTKVYTFHRGRFVVDMAQRVDNDGQTRWVGRQYRQLRHGPIVGEDNTSQFIYTFTGAAYYDGSYEKIDFEDMADNPLRKDIQGGWIAILQHYFFSSWIPNQEQTNGYYTKSLQDQAIPHYIIGMRSPALSAEPGESASFHSRFYAGPKLQEQLKEIAPGLELSVDYGIFTFLSKPLFWLLDFFHSLVGNWGFAIILVTLVIKIAFYKLSEASYRSMAKMRAVQPQLKSIKERFGDDKQRMNQALMDLYRKEKINPLGGCLPILIQIPVFIALYWVLVESVELRQAPFMLWIDDLSARDPYYVLPVLMGITMFLQQKLNPAPLDPIQQKVMMALPLVFTVFFAFFPAGLVLYWFINNLLSIGQQWVITRRMEQGAT